MVGYRRTRGTMMELRSGTITAAIRLRLSSCLKVRKMASRFESFAGKALRPRPRFKGRSPAAVAFRCGAMLALLALAGCEQLIVLHPKGIVGEGTTSLLIG